MKQLDTQFESGEGGFSSNPLTYTQITRNNDFAVYSRSRDGLVKDYEVFKIRKFKVGHQVYQKVYTEDTEEYAVTSAFGKTAWSFTGGEGAKAAAIAKFNQLSAEPIVEETNEETEEQAPKATGTRGRKAVARAAVVFPANVATWTMKDILAINPEWSQPTMYLYIQSQIEQGNVEEKGTLNVEGARGKKPVLYSKIK